MFPNSMAGLPAASPVGAHVSILMRTRDRPILLASALSGILGQVHADWHLGIVNDGGARAPVDALVDEYRTAFAGRVSVLHHARRLGPAASLNAALVASSGDFVCVHDDRDSWHPAFLDACTSFLNDPAHDRFAAVVTHCTMVGERTGEDGTDGPAGDADACIVGHVDYASVLARNSYPQISQMIRRRVVDAIGPFNADMPVLGDWDYNLRILALGDIGVVPRRLSYRHYRGSVASDEEMRVLYRNGLVRELAREAPASLGMMHVLLDEARRNQALLLAGMADLQRQLMQRSYDTDEWNGWRHDDLRRRLERVESALAETQLSVGGIHRVIDRVAQAVRPALRLWRPLFGRASR